MTRRTPHDDLDPAVAAELAALEAALAGEPATGPLEEELAGLVREVRAQAPSMPLALRERLDREVAEGFLGNRRRVRFPNASFGKVWPVAAGLAAVLIAVVVATGQLGGSDSGAPTSAKIETFSQDSGAASSASPDTGQPASKAAESAADSAAGTSTALPAAPAPTTGREVAPGTTRKVERSVDLSLTVGPGRLQDAADGVVRVTQGVGGYVQDSQVSAQGATGSAAFTLRVPTAKLDDAIAQLSKLGHVASLDQSSQDITASFTTVGERLSDARSERRALLKALGKADTSGEIAALRERIRANRSDLAALKGQLQALRRRADLTTITMSVESRKGVVAPGGSGGWTPGDAARDALRVLEVAAGVVIVAAAALVPLGLVVLLAVLIGRATRRRRREHALDGAA